MAHIDHRDGNPRNLEIDNAVLRRTPADATRDAYHDPTTALLEVYRLLAELHRDWEPRGHLSLAEIATHDALFEEARRRVEAITGADL